MLSRIAKRPNTGWLDHAGGGHHCRHSTRSPNGARLSHSPRVTVPQFYGVGTFHRNFASFINTPDAAITPGPLHASSYWAGDLERRDME